MSEPVLSCYFIIRECPSVSFPTSFGGFIALQYLSEYTFSSKYIYSPCYNLFHLKLIVHLLPTQSNGVFNFTDNEIYGCSEYFIHEA